MTSQVVTVAEIQTLTGRTFTPQETARVQMDLDAVTESLESWCRRKFVPTFIPNERHQMSGVPLFLHWGEPVGEVDVRYGTTTGDLYTYDAEEFNSSMVLRYLGYGGGNVVYVSYYVDVSRVQHFLAALKSVIIDAVLFKALAPEAVRYGILTSYSVEGLSVSYGSGSNDSGTVGGVSTVNLTSIAQLRRNVIL